MMWKRIRRMRISAGSWRRILLAAISVGVLCCGVIAVVVAKEGLAAREARELRAEITAAATRNVVTILSYRADSLDTDLAAGLAVTTPPFSDVLTRTIEQVISPTAADAGVNTKAEVLAAGVVRNDAETADVVLFVDQSTTDSERPEPRLNQITLTIGMVKSEGRWLVSEFAQG